MADLEPTDTLSDADKLLRIQLDLDELSDNQRDEQDLIDDFKAQIGREGPKAGLEESLKNHTDRQASICRRSHIALSVVGMAVDDLAQTSRNPPSVVAVKSLMDSLKYLHKEESVDTLKAVLINLGNGEAESLKNAFADLESSSKSSSSEHAPRTTKILQVKQLAIRDLVTDPLTRYPAMKRQSPRLSQSKQQGSSAKNKCLDRLDRISDAQGLHRYIDALLTLFPLSAVLEAVQNLGHKLIRRSGGSIDDDKNEETQAISVWTEHKAQSEPGEGKAKEVNLDLKNKITGLCARVQALEDRIQVTDADGTGDASDGKDGMLQTSASFTSKRRLSSALEDETDIKTRRY